MDIPSYYSKPAIILLEREFDSVDLSNGMIEVSITVTSFPPGFNTATDHINIGMDVEHRNWVRSMGC